MMTPMAGRRPFTTIETGSWGGRLEPPASLGPLERKAFVDLVGACPLQQFQSCDAPLLSRWAELELQAQQAAAELRANGMVVAGKLSPWLSVHAQAVKGQSLLALRLRLGPQSRLQKAPKSLPAPLSGYEKLAMLDEGDDDEEEAQPS
jgi:hypothetical protein